MSRSNIAFIIFSLALIALLAGCGNDQPQTCEDTGCSANQECVNNTCICTPDYMKCDVSCIPLDNCCTNADCNPDEKCVMGQCTNPCGNVTCPDTMMCSQGDCVCGTGMKQCNETCIPSGGCCSDAECGNSSLCIDNQCGDICLVTECRQNEYCISGECLCKENYFRASSGSCLAKGLCAKSIDCLGNETCVQGMCMEDCYSYSEPIQVSECFLRQAEETEDIDTCKLVKEDKRDICYLNVAVAARNREYCLLLPVSQPLDMFFYNRQNCVIEIAKDAMDTSRCKDVPKATELDPPNRDHYCIWWVLDHIEDVTLESISECGDDCDCRYRYATREGVKYCSQVCDGNTTKCLDYFYEG